LWAAVWQTSGGDGWTSGARRGRAVVVRKGPALPYSDQRALLVRMLGQLRPPIARGMERAGSDESAGRRGSIISRPRRRHTTRPTRVPAQGWRRDITNSRAPVDDPSCARIGKSEAGLRVRCWMQASGTAEAVKHMAVFRRSRLGSRRQDEGPGGQRKYTASRLSEPSMKIG
jgi:hypothetical protein